MRNLIVKNFALDYWVVIFGKTYNYTRSARIIYPLFVLSYLSQDTIFQWLAYATTITALFFGFIYFRIKPLTGDDFDYMDETQRVQFGIKAPEKLSPQQFKEYLILRNTLTKRYGI
jgi:hypothetical protein